MHGLVNHEPAVPEWFGINFLSVIPAFASFGFYRLWLSIVEWKKERFYSPALQEGLNLHLNGWDNAKFALIYIDIALIAIVAPLAIHYGLPIIAFVIFAVVDIACFLGLLESIFVAY